MSDPRPLAGLNALITRPAHQAENLCALIERKGGATSRLPLFAVEPLLSNRDETAQALLDARDFDAWIFTSANAVRQAVRLDAKVRKWPKLIATAGTATASVLAEAGRADGRVPALRDGAAGVLAMDEFARLKGKNVLIVTGENTLPDLGRGLRERGARVVSLPVYRRVMVKHPMAKVDSAIRAADVILLSSGEALQRLARAASFASGLASKQLAVPSARVVEHARKLGFLHAPLLPSRVTDAAFVEVLEHWWRDQPAD